MKDLPGFKKFYAALRARMTYAETTGSNYSAENKTSSAVGKYQFLWGTWGTKIKQFSKKSGFGSNIDKEDFKNLPKLQEAFFEHYAKTTVYPKTVELSKSENKRNLDIDEIGQLVHMNNSGSHVKTYMSGGKFNVGGKNLPPKEYLERGKRGMEAIGAKPVRKADTFSIEDKRKKIDEYFAEKESIKKSDYHEDAKNLQIQSLNSQYNDLGLVNEINKTIQNRNAESETVFKNDKAVFETFYELFEDATQNGDKVDLKHTEKGPYINALFKSERAKKVLELMQQENPNAIKVTKHKEGTTEYSRLNFSLDKRNPTAKLFAENIKKYNGMDVFSEKEGLKSLFEKNLINVPDEKIGFTALKKAITNIGETSTKKISFDKEFEYPEDQSIKQSSLTHKKKQLGYDFKEKPVKTSTVSKVDEEVAQKKDEAKVVEVANKEEQSQLASFLDEEMPLEVPDDLNYDKNNFKKEIPFDAVASGLVGLLGISRQDNPIPKRDEQVSAGVEDYVAKMGELSKMGLPADVEAEAKNKIASGYQQGLKNIVEASAGNRNLVLGNQASLDLASMLSTSQIGIEDFKAKNAALEQYGQGAMYINEFNSNRDISNRQLEQDLAMRKNQQAEGLIESGFSAMISSFQGARENGPGSARHMLSSLVRQNAFGYDPDMKDNGKGDTKGTRSWYQKNVVEKVKGHNENIKSLKDQYNTFDEKKKNFMNLVYGKTQDVDKLKKAAEFASKGNFIEGDNDNLSNAVLSDDYESLRKFNELPEAKAENASNLNDYLNTT